MAVRQSFIPDSQSYSPDDDNYDPYNVMTQPMASQPSTPLSGGSQSFAKSTSTTPDLSPIAPPGYRGTGGVATNPAEPGGITGNLNPTGPLAPIPPTQSTTSQQSAAPTAQPGTSPITNNIHSTNGTSLNVDALGRLYDANGNPVLGSNGQQIQYQGVTGTYVPPPPKPGTPSSTTPNTDSPLNNALDSNILSFLKSQGLTGQQQSLLGTVNQIIAGGGALPSDNTLEQQQLEQARESESQAETAQLNDARDALASRGLVSEPGVPQGSEADAILQIQRALAPGYSQAVQGIQSQQIQTQNARLASAISTATGITGQAATDYLNTLGTGSSRTLGLSQIALDSLSQDQSWQEFLANYGLNRDQILNQIQQGNTSSLTSLISLFLQYVGQTSGGHI